MLDVSSFAASGRRHVFDLRLCRETQIQSRLSQNEFDLDWLEAVRSFGRLLSGGSFSLIISLFESEPGS